MITLDARNFLPPLGKNLQIQHQQPQHKLKPTTTRRKLAILSTIGVPATLLFGLTSVARCEQVRLEDVDNPKLREAIRAAVSGDFDYAEALFSELLSEDDTNASVWSNRGNVRVSLKKYQQALEDYTKAVILAPGAPVPLLNRAIANEALGNYGDAIADCEAAIKIDPREYAAWYNLGNVDVRVKNYAAAASAYERAATLAPGIAGYRFKQALVLFQLDQVQAAKKLLQGLVRKYPNYAEAHAALAALLWKEGNRSQAEDQFNQAGVQNPNFSDARWIGSSLEWPPAVVDAMDKFLEINIK
ncbi:small glutamine-rich tetratricopeptide repeat-containing protein alpha-like isoform X1 [Selaginella moellendorffii]|uniref:small glutamine-rich tetratricopeptide repeat-containing protein alpha-like isoform X1 n=1 Tax=Selaginella moellendorffii TaxID=88036 RepID=UPI000D1CB532|nr:small glutamine-rich tetratricopeptide repeat-containing protein alpha-like isoform X1 [Selaginella moellendorffii]|eukprot:XP_024534367.1 small glutamine-rich tetratricopeptide repeat-containing protein alpha-like isoform X1 [Selaginella moellendorffii]